MPKREIIAFQGERGAFSEIAARHFLGAGVDVLPCERFEQVFRAVQDGQATAAAIPVENTLHGSVHENYDHLVHFDLKILAETSVRIVHNLIAAPGTALKDVRRVFSHPVALNQCLNFFAAHPQCERVTFYDTAGSVKMLMADRPANSAAIASAAAAEIYGARILKKSIEDDRQNFTRFFLLRPASAKQAPVVRHPKISLALTTPDRPGALFRVLAALALRDISLNKIESRPVRGRPWEYRFYLDFMGHLDDPKVGHALDHLRELSDTLRIFGCYEEGARADAVRK